MCGRHRRRMRGGRRWQARLHAAHRLLLMVTAWHHNRSEPLHCAAAACHAARTPWQPLVRAGLDAPTRAYRHAAAFHALGAATRGAAGHGRRRHGATAAPHTAAARTAAHAPRIPIAHAAIFGARCKRTRFALFQHGVLVAGESAVLRATGNASRAVTRTQAASTMAAPPCSPATQNAVHGTLSMRTRLALAQHRAFIATPARLHHN